MSDFPTLRFPFMHFTAKQGKRAAEKSSDKMRLQTARLNPLHIFPNRHHPPHIHGVVHQCPFLKQLHEGFPVQRLADHLIQPVANFRQITVTDGFNQ